MKRIIICSVLIMFSVQFAISQELMDKVVATVGNEPILLTDIEQQYSYMKERQPKLEPSAKCGILENLLIQNLLLNQARLDSIVVKDEEINAEVNTRVEEILKYMGNDEAQFQEYYNKNVSEVKTQMHDPVLQQILVRKMRQEILSKITITPSEVKKFFNQMPKDSLPYLSSEVELAEIIYKPKVNATQKKIALDKITDIRKKIVTDGEDFKKMAEKFSADLGSARNGGDLGLVKRGSFVPEFEGAAYNLEKDEISPVIETEYGYHIIQLIERKGNLIHCRHILIKPEITEEDIKNASLALDSIRTKILKDSISFSMAVKKYSDKKSLNYDNDGLMMNPQTGNTTFEIRDLEPDIYFAEDKLKVGEISPPVQQKDQAGETVFLLIKLLSRTTPHKANLQQDYKKIADASLENKKNTFLIEWLIAHADNTHIEIDPMFDNCGLLKKWNAIAKQ